MIRSDRENKLALAQDHMRITPRPLDSAFGSMSIDLTLHEEISFWTPPPEESGSPVVVYPGREGFDPFQLLHQHGTTLLLPADGFFLKPGAFVLVIIAEK